MAVPYLMSHPSDNQQITTLTHGNTVVSALLDTGASDNFIAASVFSKLSKHTVIKSGHIDEEATLANGSEFRLKKKVLLQWRVGNIQYKSHFFVMKNVSHDAILGCTFLDITNANIDFPTKNTNDNETIVLPPN